jgi:hypothetical protein
MRAGRSSVATHLRRAFTRRVATSRPPTRVCAGGVRPRGRGTRGYRSFRLTCRHDLPGSGRRCRIAHGSLRLDGRTHRMRSPFTSRTEKPTQCLPTRFIASSLTAFAIFDIRFRKRDGRRTSSVFAARQEADDLAPKRGLLFARQRGCVEDRTPIEKRNGPHKVSTLSV